MHLYLVALACLGLMAGLLGVMIVFWERQRELRLDERHGFDVKLTGRSPVLQERDNDHG